jgi:hypothetical protein
MRAKHLWQENVMEQRQPPHNWRTRADPLEAIWPLALEMLRDAPELEAKAIFAHQSEIHFPSSRSSFKSAPRTVIASPACGKVVP